MTYAGDISPEDAWRLINEDPKAQLIDVRTAAELTWVGMPDMAGTGRTLIAVEWITYPEMEENTTFVAEIKNVVEDPEAPLLFICRSGVRSRFAAEAMTAAGYKACYNVATGFEGDRDDGDHRGSVGGWKVANLPWRQT